MLELSGSARERGRQHGEARRTAIRDRIERSLGECAGGSGRPAGERLAAPWWAAVRRSAPLIAAEIGGIAEALGSSLAEIVLLNAFEAVAVAEQGELGGCTSIGVPTPAGAVVAQNWDANPSLAASLPATAPAPPSD